jgi:hypothetical protein
MELKDNEVQNFAIDPWSKIAVAQRLLWSMKLQEAENLIKPYIESSLWCALEWAEIALWRFSFNEKEENENDFLKRLELVETKANEQLANNTIEKTFFSTLINSAPLNFSVETYLNYLDSIVVLAYVHLANSLFHFRKQNPVRGKFELMSLGVTKRKPYESPMS